MTRVSAINLVDLPSQPVLSVRSTIDATTELNQWLDRAVGAVQSRLAELEANPAGPPFACFRGSDLSSLDVEAGFPTATLMAGDGTVQARTIEPSTAAIVIDRGPYEESDPTMGEAMVWIAERGRELAGPIYYSYLNEPSVPAEDLLTQMVFPVLG